MRNSTQQLIVLIYRGVGESVGKKRDVLVRQRNIVAQHLGHVQSNGRRRPWCCCLRGWVVAGGIELAGDGLATCKVGGSRS